MRLDPAKLAAEFVIIVVGILVALATDSAWQNRSDRQQEAEELRRLTREFQEERDFFTSELVFFQQQVEAVEEMLALLQAAPIDAMVSVPNALAIETLYSPTWDAQFPILNSLISSGRLRLITDAGIRDRIGRLQGSIRNTTENQARARNFYVNELLPILRSSGDITMLLTIRRDYAHRESLGETALLNTLELQNAIAEKILWADLALDTSTGLIRRLENTLREIEQAE